MNIRNFRNIDTDDILDLLGLEHKRTTVDWALPAVGIFAVGVLVGAGIGLLFAPKTGTQLREDLGNRMSNRFQGARDFLGEVPSKLGMGEHQGGQTSQQVSGGSSRGRSTNI